MHRPVVQLPGGDAPTDALIHNQVEGEVFDEELGRMRQRLAIHGVQHGVAGAVRRRAGALDRGLTIVLGHAAKGTLIDLAIFRAGERHAPVLQLVHSGGRVAAQVLDGVLIAQPVRPLDGVEHVPAPVVLAHVAERRRNPALRRDRVRAGGKDLGDAGRLQARLRAAQSRAQARASGADHHHVELVIDEIVRRHGFRRPLERL